MQRVLTLRRVLRRLPLSATSASSLQRASSSAATAPAPAPLPVAPAAVPSAPTPEPATSASSASSSIWDKLVAFVGGIAIGGAYFIYLSQTEGLSSGATEAVAAVRAEALASSAETDRRLALLEHQVVALRTEIAARS